jgi:hypothetical protein
MPAWESPLINSPVKSTPFFRLALVTAGAIGIAGYHLGVDDGEIYVPAAQKLLHPALFPYGTEFFQSHEHLSLFASILAWTARLTHLSMDLTIFVWYTLTTFALLVSCWMLASVCFSTERARWASVLVIATILTMPATNTGLLLMDPYMTARSFSTPLTIFALTAFLSRRYGLATVLTLVTATIHPQMAAYVVFPAALLWMMERNQVTIAEPVPVSSVALSIVPVGFNLAPAQGAYREALYARDFYFLSTWTWYHWLGLLAPLAFLAWFWKGNLRGTTQEFKRISFVLIPFGIVSIVAGAIISSTHDLDMYARLQPLRCFHLITLVFMLLFAGLIGEYTSAKKFRWVLPTLLTGLTVGMGYVGYASYPYSPRIEIPGRNSTSNAWLDTTWWIRHNTPQDAVFALDSRYLDVDGVDWHGFRALSERSALADYYKDGGVVAIFPNLATEWKQMSDATLGLNSFNADQFTRLAHEYPVTWTVIHGSAPSGLNCPYDQRGYAVCQIPGAPGMTEAGSSLAAAGSTPKAEAQSAPVSQVR